MAERGCTRCKGCPDRAVGCHAVCEDYKAFRAEREAEYKIRASYHAGEPANKAKRDAHRRWQRQELRRR